MLTSPVIMLVDDEPQALTALLGALAKRFGRDYQVVSHLSAAAALEDLDRIRPRAGTRRWSSPTIGCRKCRALSS